MVLTLFILSSLVFEKNTIHLIQAIKLALDQGTYGCGIFVDLQKAFDTVHPNILMGKL